MKVEIQMQGLDGVLESLRTLPPEVVSKNGGPVKTALRTGARLIAYEAKKNLRVAVSNTDDESKKYSTGLLMENVVVRRGKKPTGSNGEKVLVSIKNKRYERKGKEVTTRKTASLLEYGSSKQPAEPWLRPAFNSKAQEAISTIESDLKKRIEKIVAKLAAQNVGK